MIKSMTGYGKQLVEFTGKSVIIEIRSLNSRQMDVNTRISSIYREKDLDIRNILSKSLERGKVDFSLYVEYSGSNAGYAVSEETALEYFKGLKALEEKLPGNETRDYLSILARMPEVVKSDREEIVDEEWEQVLEGLEAALADVDAFRIEEGRTMLADIQGRIHEIESLLEQTQPFEENRLGSIRERINRQIENLDVKQVDPDRFEQEMIYYLEKLDITEEKVRLKKHCEYFIQVMTEEQAQGKKLGFIAQEIGREINTLGSKASDVEIQRLVVRMKDELEKIKEQLMNIL